MTDARRTGIGGVQAQRVLVEIGRASILTHRELCRRMTDEIAPARVSEIASDLSRRGFINQTKLRGALAYSLTSLGEYQLPSYAPLQAVPFTPLRTAVAPPRRAGSDDHKRLPSVLTGRAPIRNQGPA